MKIHHKYTMRVICIISSVVLLVGSSAARSEWSGRLATLSEAQAACADIDSAQCLPFLAEAVAISDLLNELSNPKNIKGNERVLLPGRMMTVWDCDRAIFDELNGHKLSRKALTLSSSKSQNMYWTQAVRIVAYDLCKPAE